MADDYDSNDWGSKWETGSPHWRTSDVGWGSSITWWDRRWDSRRGGQVVSSLLSGTWGAISRTKYFKTNEWSGTCRPLKEYAMRIRWSQWHEALCLLGHMLRQSLVSDVITHSAAISVCGKGQRPQQALHLLQEMQLRGLVPDVIYI